MATLTIVMVLFFIMAMVAAYANRNLIFEQRTSANNYRSTQASSAAEAGIDWVIAMLNGGRIDASCLPTSAVGETSFRSRYLTLNADGGYSRVPPASPPTNAACGLVGVLSGVTPTGTSQGWTCTCPAPGTSPAFAAVLPEGTPVFVAELGLANFLVAPQPTAGAPGFLRLTVRGCNEVGTGSQACHRAGLSTVSQTTTAQTKVEVTLGLVRALPIPPVAAVTAGGTITASAGVNLRVTNADPSTAVTLHSGGAVTVTPSVILSGPPGSTSTTVTANDAGLGALVVAGRVFESLFGMDAVTFQRQPAAFQLTCAGTCTTADLSAAVAANPGRVIWVPGALNLNSATPSPTDLGSAAQPVMVIVNGDMTIASPTALIGLLYGNNVTVSAGGAGSWPHKTSSSNGRSLRSMPPAPMPSSSAAPTGTP
ncbi:MAG: pilus assembly PilX N-terminal domain-containing protein [Burkholderiales bacterium]|nr:pilus assembly PilX N-terminal domain-containing protein [Burkholderiales bacterium]